MRELNSNEIQDISGGGVDVGNIDMASIGLGVSILALGILVVASAGLATVPISALGAVTVGESIIVGTGITTSVTGGGLIGMGLGSGAGRLLQNQS